MNDMSETNSSLLTAMPRLRAFAISLCGNADDANDLVQQTMVKALTNIHSFEPGTNMPAWLHTILRNEFYSDFHRRRHEVPDDDGMHASLLEIRATQESHLEFLELRDAFTKLHDLQRKALAMIAAGLSYEDAADICGCAVGTIKSRVHRARSKLAFEPQPASA